MKTVLITGAGSGIGRSTALHLNNLGYEVYATSRSLDELEELKKAGCKVLKLDVTNESEITKAVKTIITSSGKIDVLINNAGFGLYGAVEDVPLDDARYQFEVNLFGLARLTQEVLPHMRSNKSGTVINISSMGGKIYTPLGAWYYATKHALEGWSDTLRLELKQFKIHIVIVEPGVIKTNFAHAAEKLKGYSKDSVYRKLSNKTAASLKNTYRVDGSGSEPLLIAKTIQKVIESKTPKTRYAAGKYSKLMIFLHKYLPPRLFDKIVSRV